MKHCLRFKWMLLAGLIGGCVEPGLDGHETNGIHTEFVPRASALAFTPITLAVRDANGQPSADCPGCDTASNYVLQDANDVLRLLYMGIHHDAAATLGCGSDVRRTLVKQWATLGLACPGGCVGGGLRHAWRGGDRSPETKGFLQSLGLELPPAFSTRMPKLIRGFCNAEPVAQYEGASDYQDADPIRIPCEAPAGTPSTGIIDEVCHSQVSRPEWKGRWGWCCPSRYLISWDPVPVTSTLRACVRLAPSLTFRQPDPRLSARVRRVRPALVGNA